MYLNNLLLDTLNIQEISIQFKIKIDNLNISKWSCNW